MKELVSQINGAIHQFETVLLPKLPMVSSDPQDGTELQKRLGELRRIQEEASRDPVFSIRFLGDTQNGKSTLINSLLGRKVLPEGHVGACSATIVRCRYSDQKEITIEFRYATAEEFQSELEEKCLDAEQVLIEEQIEAKQREVISGLLGRFVRLFDINVEDVPTVELIARCREQANIFKEKDLLGTREKLVVSSDTEEAIKQNLSAKGRRAFIVDECLIEGAFPDWHPAMELVDMPGTNAFNPHDDQVNSRLKQKVCGLAMVTKETQLNSTVMEWFKETSILQDIAGASERNQVRVFILKSFVDQLNLNEDDERSKWEQTKSYCEEIDTHLRGQVMDLVRQRFTEENEIDVLKSFVERLPLHFLSPKVYRALSDEGLRKRVQQDPLKHLQLAEGFQRFDGKSENTGIPGLKGDLRQQTENYIESHFRTKVRLDFEKEVGQVARFFRTQRVGVEQRLANQGAFITEVNKALRAELVRCIGSHHQETEAKIIELKRRFKEDVGKLVEQVSDSFAAKAQKRLEEWLMYHWATLRCAGRKNGQHVTARGYEIDFNGELADFCVKALNSAWIRQRNNLRKKFFGNLREEFIPAMQAHVAQAKGHDPLRIKLIESTYEETVESSKQCLDLKSAEYDANAEAFDSLRPKLAQKIKNALKSTYEGIAAESGRGSSRRMRNQLNEGVISNIPNIGRLVRDGVSENWDGLTAALEKHVMEFFAETKSGITNQAKSLDRLAANPSEGDEQLIVNLGELENDVSTWLKKETA